MNVNEINCGSARSMFDKTPQIQSTDPHHTPLFNSRITKTYVEYLKQYRPEVDIDIVLARAGMTVYQVEDGGHWFSQDQISRFQEALFEKTGDFTIPREAGRFIALSRGSSPMQKFTLGLGSPELTYQRLEKVLPQITRAHHVKTRRLGSNVMEVVVTTIPGLTEHPGQCPNRMGMLEAIAKLFTDKYARIEHPECMNKGGESCRYIITWEKTSLQRWRKIRSFGMLLGVPAGAVILYLMPSLYGVLSVSLLISLILTIAFYAGYLGEKEFAKTLMHEGTMAGELMDQVNQSYNNTLLVQEIGQACASIFNVDRLLRNIMEIIENRTDFKRGFIMSQNRRAECLTFTVGYGYDEQSKDLLDKMEISIGNHSFGDPLVEAFMAQKPTLVNNLSEIQKTVAHATYDILEMTGVHSFMCIPIHYENVLEGLLIVEPHDADRPFNQSDMNLLAGIATSVGISINNIRAYERIREREERFRSLSENAPDIIYTLALDGSFTYVNPAAKKILGYEPQEMFNRYFIHFAREADKKFYINLFKRIRDDRDIISEIDGVLLRKDGSERFVSMGGAPNFDSGGGVIGIVGTLKDVTDRKRADEALRDSEEKFRTITATARDAIIMINNKGQIAYWNPAAEEMFGYTKEELDGKILHTVLAPVHYHDEYEQGFDEFIKTGGGDAIGKTIDLKGQRKNGSVFPVELSISAIQMERQWWAVGIARDVTDRKQAEEALFKEKERFQIFTEASPLGIALLGKEGVIKYLNPQFSKIFGYNIDDIPHISEWFNRAYPDRQCKEDITTTWKNHMEDGSNDLHPRTHAVRCKDGSDKMVQFRSVMLETEEWMILCEDITKTRQLENQLQHAQKMEAIGTLAGGIAHDFNNLLMGILGYSSLMLLEVDIGHPFHEKLKMIETQVKSGAELTRQLLGFARGGKYEVKPTDMNEILEKTSTMFGRTRKEIKIHTKYHADLWAVEVDRGQIDQVLLNFYLNAWQAMPGGGDLFIETRNVHLDANHSKTFGVKQGRYVMFSITDTGIGMDVNTQERIFEPFFTTKDMGRGTGLGLASVYGIVKSHNGHINVQSVKNQGTTFSVYLPASEIEAERQTMTGETTIRGSELILIVDDEETIIEISRKILESLGYRVVTARGGEEATSIYREQMDEIDLVILDMIMPDISGRETYDVLKTINPHIKVLLSSGYSLSGQAQEIINRGCQGFIQKPFTVTALSQKIRDVLNDKSLLIDSRVHEK